MTNSQANAAESAAGSRTPRAGTKSRSPAERDAPASGPVPMNGLTITRWNLGLSLSLAVTILGGAFMLQWDRTSGVEAEVRDLRAQVGDLGVQVGSLRVELHTEINGLRQELHTEISGLRHEVGAEIDGLRRELREEVGGLREEIRDLAELIRAREAPAPSAQ